MSAPFEPGQRVTVDREQDHCSKCGSTELKFIRNLGAGAGEFYCGCDLAAVMPYSRRYEDVTPVGAR